MINNFLKKLTRIQLAIGGCILVLMIFLTCSNIFFRQFGMPVRGTFELMGYMGALIFALSFGYSHEKKEHIYVSILFDRFPPKVKLAARIVNSLLAIIFFALLSFQLVKNAINLKNVEELSETLRIAYYPVILVLAFGTAYIVIQLIYELFKLRGDRS